MKKSTIHLLAALLLLFPGYLRAQDLWLRSAGGSNLDEALDIAYTAGGNAYYVAGHFSGSANFGPAEKFLRAANR